MLVQLRSGLGPLQLFTFGFGTIVGIAWVVLMGQLLASAGLAGALIGLTVGALMMASIGVCYAEMGALFPVAGGEVAYVRNVYGAKIAHLLGWFLLLSCLLVCGFEMVSVGWILAQLWPALARTRLYSFLGNDVYLEPFLLSVAVQGLIARANFVGVREAGRLQAFTTGMKIALSVCFIAAGLRIARFDYGNPLFVLDAGGSALPGIISVITIAPFWFSGFNAVSQTLSERSGTLTPAHAARMILISLAAAWAFYCLVLLSMSLVMPRATLLSQVLPTAAAFQAAFRSPLLGNVVLFAGLLGLVSTWNALFFSSTRILLVLASDRFVSPTLASLHTKHRTPSMAITLVGLAIPLIALLGRGVIGPVLSAFSIVMAGIYAAVCLALLSLRKRSAVNVAPLRIVSRALPYVALGACLIIALFALIEPLRDWRNGRFPVSWLVLLLWGAMGLWLARRQAASAGV
jgi:APA family basic amino acid/polyamine antiporter